MLVACSSHDDASFKKILAFLAIESRRRGREDDLVDLLGHRRDIVAVSRVEWNASSRLDGERRSSSAVETVCRPWTALPARTHPVEGCRTRKRSREGGCCASAASCGQIAAWRNAAAPFQQPLLPLPPLLTLLPHRKRSVIPLVDCLLRLLRGQWVVEGRGHEPSSV